MRDFSEKNEGGSNDGNDKNVRNGDAASQMNRNDGLDITNTNQPNLHESHSVVANESLLSVC